MSADIHTPSSSISLNCAVLTVSRSRTAENDTSGDWLTQALTEAGHVCAQRGLVREDIYLIRQILSNWIADPSIQVIITNGGTGFIGAQGTIEAVAPLLDREIPGFGELFRQVSFQEIGASTIQSRALAGYANRKVLFCLPGSTSACQTAWEQILRSQLDSQYKPCNFATQLTPKR